MARNMPCLTAGSILPKDTFQILSQEGDVSFHHGAIVWIRMKNFMKCDDTIMFADPCLNVIIGPNGAGKSTILCAICLGLGGKPQYIGRDNHVSSFVKVGCESAQLEIALHNVKGENYIIKSVLFRKGGIKWQLNEKSVTKGQIDDLVKGLKIQLDNLCQFLPQERVQHFVKMNEFQLLESTEKVAGSDNLYENHQKLKEIRDEVRSWESRRETKTKQLTSSKQKNSRLEEDVRNFKERERILKEVEACRVKKLFLDYKDKQKRCIEMEKSMKDLQKEVREANIKADSFQKSIHEEHKKYSEYRKQAQDAQKKIHSSEERVDRYRSQLQEEELKIQEAITNYESLQERRRGDQQRAEVIQRRVENLEQQLQECTQQYVQHEHDGTIREMQELSQQLATVNNQCSDLDHELRSLKFAMNRYERQMQDLKNIHQKHMEVVKRNFPQLHSAILWLRQNQHQLRAPVHEPMLMSLNVHDAQNAKYIESRIQRRDLIAFVCEDKQDMDFLMIKLREEMGLKVNFVHSEPIPPNEYKPQIPLQHLQKLGFFAYLRDLFDAPDAVTSFLCRQYKVHLIPVGDERCEQNLEHILKKTDLIHFYAGSSSVVRSKSRYSNKSMTNISQIGAAQLLSISTDVNLEQSLKHQIEEANRQEAALRQELVIASKQRQDLEKKQETVRQRAYNLRELREKRNGLESQLQRKRAEYESIVKKIESFNLEHEQQCLQERCKSHPLKMSIIVLSMAEETSKVLEYIREKDFASLSADRVSSQRRELEGQLRNAQDALNTVKSGLQEQEAKLESLREEARTVLQDYTNEAKKFKIKKEDLEKLPNDLQVLNTNMHEMEAKANCMISTDRSVVEEYNRRVEEIRGLEEDVQHLNHTLVSRQASLVALKQTWLPALKDVIDRVNRNYSQYLECLDCAGEVYLHTGDNEDDFDKYGIKIRVKFRAEEELRELTAYWQSGGEKSICTILYLLALQDLFSAPFLCMDEINQGMDAMNERRIFELLVHVSQEKLRRNQYFLLTPKLLLNLPFNDKMMVHVILDGIDAGEANQD